MATAIEYALMSGASYISTRAEINRFPVPEGWTEIIDKREDHASGFEAATFINGTEIVISYAGTYPTSPMDWMANSTLGAGVPGVDQLLEAAQYYLSIKAQYGDNISFAGHSLGGGLASLMGALFNHQAFTFDQAPFGYSLNTDSVAALLSQLKATNLYTPAQLLPLQEYADAFTNTSTIGGATGEVVGVVGGFIGLGTWLGASIAILTASIGRVIVGNQLENSLSTARAGNVIDINLEGEALRYLPFPRIGSQSDVPVNTTGVSSVNLHDQTLLSAFLQSYQTATKDRALSDVTFKLNDLLKMIFDANLFARSTGTGNTSEPNFLEFIVNHEAGFDPRAQSKIAPNAMVTRFTSDLWKLAQDGGMTMSDGVDVRGTNIDYLHNVSKALTAFAMQMYYEGTANATNPKKELFTKITGGVQFDMADVSKTFKSAFDNNEKLNLKDAKGYKEYFDEYLNGYIATFFNPAERSLINSLLPYMRDWYVQASTTGMTATDSLNRGAFMLGGSGADTLTGGSKADLLVGNAGDDILTGGKGNDFLLGGTGNDTYKYNTGDGFDTLLDSDGNGRILMDGKSLAGGAQYGDTHVHRDSDKHLYVDVGNGRMVIDGNILIEGYRAGQLGLTLSGPMAEPADPQITGSTINGDLAPTDFDTLHDGVQIMYDSLGNIITAPDNKPDPDRNDVLFGSGGNDRIISGGGDDILYAPQGGEDLLEAGSGRDRIYAGAGNDILVGGSDGDILSGGEGDDKLFADSRMVTATAITQGNTDANVNAQGDWLAAGSGNDTLVGSAANDVLMGGGGSDLLIGGAGDDHIRGDIDWVTDSLNWTATLTQTGVLFQPASGTQFPVDAAADVIYAGNGADVVMSGLGNDVIFGEAGKDWLYGEEGNDTILGGDGTDLLVGDGGESPADTVGNDYLDGGANDDAIYGCAGDDIIIGGTGNDTLYGDAGRDTYIFNKGDGIDTIYDSSDQLNSKDNILRFGAGFSASNVTLRLGSLMLDLGNGDAIHINNEDQADANGFDRNDVFNSSSIGSFEFADGTVLTSTELLARGFDFDGTEGDDIILGTNTVDRINGLGGNDTLEGGAADDTLTGGAGNDLLTGGTGSDTYLFNRGDGQDIIADGGPSTSSGQASSVDTLQFGADILQSDVIVRRTPAGELEFSIMGSSDRITVPGWYTADADANRIERIVFGDGTTLTPADFENLPITGTDGDDVIDGTTAVDTLLGMGGNDMLNGGQGNDILDGGTGSDVLDGGAGEDSLIGGGGQDTIVMGYGMGLDTLADASALGGTLQLNGILKSSDLSFVQQGNDLFVQVGGPSDGLVIKDYYANPQAVWSVQDASSNTATTVQTIMDGIASKTEVELAEGAFIAQTKADIINGYLAQGYAIQSDGSFHLQQLVMPVSAYAYNTVSTITTIATQHYNNGSTVALPATHSTVQTWDEQYAPPVHDYSAFVNTSVTFTDAPVVYATDDSSQTTYGTKWLKMSWISTPVRTWDDPAKTMIFYIYDRGFSSSQYATDLGALIGTEAITTLQTNTQYAMSGTVTGILSAPGNWQAGGSFPQIVAVSNEINIDTREIQAITLGDSGQTVYANVQTLVHGGKGNDTIYNAGLASGGDGNDVIDGGASQYGESGDDVLSNGQLLNGGVGDDLLLGGSVLIGGAGNDTMDGGSYGSGDSRYVIDPMQTGIDLIRDTSDSDIAYRNWYYGTLGIENFEIHEQWGGYYTSHSISSDTGYFTSQELNDPNNWIAGWFARHPSDLLYIEPLPAVIKPASNDYAALQAAYDAGVIPKDTLEFSEGITLADLQLTWGEVMQESPTSGMLERYRTLNLSWNGGASQVQLVIPHGEDPLGSGVEQVKFADNTIIGMQDLIAMAPAGVSLDPQIYQYEPGMGQQVLGSGYSSINFGPGITSSMITLGLGSLMIRVGDGGDVIHIENFNPADALATNTIRSFIFADGTSLSYEQLLSRGFDIYGTSADETLSGTNLVNRIYGVGGNDILIGTGTSDMLVSGVGIDTLIGGMGNETFVVNDAGDIIIANANAASNTVMASFDYVLPDNVKNITLVGNNNLIAAGNDFDNVITGNAGNSTLIAGVGNDALIAGTGGGTMIGGSGITTFVLNANSGLQTIIDTDKATGDTIRFGEGISARDIVFRQQGVDMLVTYSAHGSVLLKNYDLFSTDTPPLIGEWQFADGSSITITCGDNYDGAGSFGVNQYDARGNLLGEQWGYNDGSFGSIIYYADGSICTTWQRPDGAHGQEYEYADGSSSETIYNADGSYLIYTGDVEGNGIEVSYNASGVKTGDRWGRVDGTYGWDSFNADGSSSGATYNQYRSYSEYANDGQGYLITTNYSSGGVRLSDSWVKADGTSGGDTFNPDGSHSSSINDGLGKITTTNYGIGGNELGYSIAISDASGNITTTNYDAGGNALGYSVVTVDVLGNVTAMNYDANGVELGYSITTTDSSGKVTKRNFDASGSAMGYSVTTSDGLGVVTTVDYDVSGIRLRNSWSRADGTSGGSTYNSDQSFSTIYNDQYGKTLTSNYVLGAILPPPPPPPSIPGIPTPPSPPPSAMPVLVSASSRVHDWHGNTTTTNYDGSWHVLGTVVSNYDMLGNVVSTNYDASGIKISINWSKADSSHGNDTFNADGSSSGVSYNADGSHSAYTNDGLGEITTTSFDADGNELGHSVALNDNHGTVTTTRHDAIGTVLGSVSVVNDGQGNLITTNYDASGNKVSDSWTMADGTYGSDTFNADGSSKGASYNVDGSRSSYTSDGQGNVTTKLYDALNHLIGNQWEHADGSYGSDVIDPVTGAKVSGMVTNPAKGYTSTYTRALLGNGDVETVLSYTYTNGSTYTTDTVKQADGSYVQAWSKSDGSSGTTNYNAVTLEKSGTIINPVKGYSQVFDNTVLADGSTQAVLAYTYTDGSTYATDTVKQADGSYVQAWSKSDGSSGTTNYNAATLEKSGTIVNPAKGYSQVFDNTVQADGSTEAILAYTYTDGSTYTTDTVKQADGSYVQTWSRSDGSSGITNYVAVTGEKSGTIINPVKGYSQVFDNTVLADGSTEALKTYTYADGSTYTIDTVKASDGSYTQVWSKSNGTSGTKVVDSTGVVVADSWVHADGSQGVNASGNHLVLGTAANNTIKALSTGNEIMIGGAGNDTLTTGPGSNLIAFDKGDGKDSVYATAGLNNTVSLGGNFVYSDLSLQHSGNDLVLNISTADSITFKGWYTGNNNIVDLQVIVSSMSDFNPASTDELRNSNVENFDFQMLVNAFDQAQIAGLSAWGVTDALLDAHLASSDSAALGGDLAYTYGTQGSLTGMGIAAAESTLSNSQFAAAPQMLNPWPALNTGAVQIR